MAPSKLTLSVPKTEQVPPQHLRYKVSIPGWALKLTNSRFSGYFGLSFFSVFSPRVDT
jgi:hypothetical protein